MAISKKKNHQNELYKDLYKAILKIQTEEECAQFFHDLCAPGEISAMEQRFAVASLLMQNKVYLEILEETNASTATISRVKRMLNEDGCLPQIIEQLQKEQLPK